MSSFADIVKGTVVDEAGEPLIGATVSEKGTTNGVPTDIDGNFQIDVPKKAVLEVSYVGYDMQSVQVNGQTDLRITLRENGENLAEVVVVGYGRDQSYYIKQRLN